MATGEIVHQSERVLIEEIKPSLSLLDLFTQFYQDNRPFLLESGVVSKKMGRYSVMGSSPWLILRSKGSHIQIDQGGRRRYQRGNPFLVVKKLMKKYKLPSLTNGNLPPFVGGAVGYFAYDLKDFVEILPSMTIDDLNLPDCYLGFYDQLVVFDHILDKLFLVVSCPAAGRREDIKLKDKLANLEKKLGQNPKLVKKTQVGEIRSQGRVKSNFTKEDYLKAVKRAREYIYAGDIYQVNLSQRFQAPLPGLSFNLWKVLRQVNPAPFSAYLKFDEVEVVSASMERFLKVERDYVQTRPIKGTRPRCPDPVLDRRLAQELLNSEKDRAENVMIVDLERNDLGRVCQIGSVRVTELTVLEQYASVFHLVSTIEGNLRPGKDNLDLLRACFPGGSITGAPKVRAMEIIEELEPTKRSVYTGSIAYLGFDGYMDSNIVIRTFLVKDRMVYFQVGGGIVADSDPEAEYEETLDKGQGLFKALGLA